MTRRFDAIHVGFRGSPAEERAIAGPIEQTGRKVLFVPPERLAAQLEQIEVLLCAEPPQVDWTRATRLRLVQFMGSGIEALWPATGFPAHAEIANARGIHLPEMRDHVLAMILAFERQLPRLFAQQARREWDRFAPGSVAGKTVGILGLGEVGRAVATACKALGMRVVGTRTGAERTPDVDEVVAPEEVDLVLRAADYLVVTVPLTPRTRGMLGGDALSKLRPSAVVVHVSRGGIVDEHALDAALRSGALRGAALDVFSTEPLPPESPLWSTPNLLVSPHIAGQVPRYVRRVMALFLENLDLVERGLPPRTRVDRDRGY